MSRPGMREVLFYGSCAVGFVAIYSALITIGLGRRLHRSAGKRVERTRRRVEHAGRDLVRRILSPA